MSNRNPMSIELFCAKEPTETEKQKLTDALTRKYGVPVILQWIADPRTPVGFRLKAGNRIYDRTPDGLLDDFKQTIAAVNKDSDDYISPVRDAIDHWQPNPHAEEVGTIATLADGVATVRGLSGVKYGEILRFENGEKALALNLTETEIGCILFDDEHTFAGERCYKTGKTAGIPVSEAFVGRVVNALGEPIDGLGKIAKGKYMPIERPAPAIIDRSPVNEPLQTGILTIDAMFPIGKGQRELIIGDRQTGKTSIALDTILNQKGKNVQCIYCAIGQKSATVKRLVKTLEEHGALAYTTVVFSAASDPAALQYIAPYAACAIGEYFMDMGRDVLIVYDDLSKHAVAYRTISLLLGRTPGREAYPGDIFYLHSRLLERSAHLNPEKGGGSITALPIVETLGGDISAYIPTNVISITDGQIFLENELFLSGQRPAINLGLSVSRVGGNAQTAAMKHAVGSLRLELAQYREMKTFAQFSGDLEDSVKEQLAFGKALTEILIQPLSAPYETWEEVVMLVVSLSKLTLGCANPRRFFADFLPRFASAYPNIVAQIQSGHPLSQDERAIIVAQAGKDLENV